MKNKKFGKDQVILQDSVVDSNTGEYVGFKDKYSGEDSGFLDFQANQEAETDPPTNSLGGLNKFVTAGEVEPDFFDADPAANTVKEEFKLEDCTEEELKDVTSECYKAATKSEMYLKNTARTLSTSPIVAVTDYAADFAKNAGRLRDSFGLNSSIMQDFYGTMSDNKSKLVSTDVTGGYDISGQNSMVASVFDRAKYIRPGNRMSANTLAYTGGEYKVGGVYDMPAIVTGKHQCLLT